jgi:hypothetical protein
LCGRLYPMSESELHQETRVRILLLVFSIASFFLWAGCTIPISRSQASKENRVQVPQGSLGRFGIQNLGSHLLVSGFVDSENGKPIPLLLDTGSDSSFLAWESHSKNKELLWSGTSFLFSTKKGIVPQGIEGILGLDFFRNYCIWWEEDFLTVYSFDSSVCTHPLAFFSTELKLLATRKKDSFYYVRFGREEKMYWGLVDSGASLSFLPSEFEQSAESLGKKTVFLAGGIIQEADLFHTQSPIRFETALGDRVSYIDFSFLRGISLEHLTFPREKDREDVWVIGLELLSRAPLFWDFKRNRIGLFTQTSK